MGVRIPGTGPTAASLVTLRRGACTVRRALPHCVSTAVTAAGGDGSILLARSASTNAQADRDRIRPLTHQLSLNRIPDIISGERVAAGINSPNSGE
jgi:hypothetical protein